MNPSQPHRPNLNGAPKLRPALPKPSLNPEERKIWLASHNAPADMLMVSVHEFQQMTLGMLNGQRMLLALKHQVEEAANHLDHYWRTQPDLGNAAAEATFDAGKYHRAVERALKDVDWAITNLQTLANLTDGGCDAVEAETAVTPIVTQLADHLGALLEFLKLQISARRPISTPPPDAPAKTP